MSLEFRHIAHAYGEEQALRNVSFSVPDGKITCLLGHSGCGKSTLLNLAAGLLEVQEGSITLGGEVLAEAGQNPPPEKRPIGLVFQDGALFPHMTIAQNVSFGVPAASEDDVREWLRRVGLEGYGARYPHELSGGQAQRVALARAMAPDPQVLLMDEPFSSLDIVLRRKLRRDCRKILKDRGATTVIVTHDPEEALDIADQIVVMTCGVVVQVGTPDAVYNEPAHAMVGKMMTGAQWIRANRSDNGFWTPFGTWPLECAHGPVPDQDILDALVHAEALALVEDAEGMIVRDIHPVGLRHRVTLSPGENSSDEIIAETDRPVSMDARYRVEPLKGSVRFLAE